MFFGNAVLGALETNHAACSSGGQLAPPNYSFRVRVLRHYSEWWICSFHFCQSRWFLTFLKLNVVHSQLVGQRVTQLTSEPDIHKIWSVPVNSPLKNKIFNKNKHKKTNKNMACWTWFCNLYGYESWWQKRISWMRLAKRCAKRDKSVE